MLSKNAIGNLNNRYKAVLKKCNLINTFGSLALMAILTMGGGTFLVENAFAAENTDDIISMDATDGSSQTTPNSAPIFDDPVLTNNGTIENGALYKIPMTPMVFANSKIGMFGYDDSATGTGYSFTNNGILNVKTIENTNTYVSFLYGMYANSNNTHTLINTAGSTMTIAAETEDVTEDAQITLNISNIHAMAAIGDASHTITNDGDINMNISGGAATVISSFNYSATNEISNIHALFAEESSGNTLVNNGSINIDATTADVTGISMGNTRITSISGISAAYSLSGNSTIINSKDAEIVINATSGNAKGTNALNAMSGAEVSILGIYTDSPGLQTVTNEGTIRINATSGSATGTAGSIIADVDASGVSAQVGNSVINNSGLIEVTGIGGTATNNRPSGTASANVRVSGIQLGSPTATLTNTGVINVSATANQVGALAMAHEVYSYSNFTVDTWATKLRDWSGNDTVFGLANGNTVTFANGTAGATLIVRPGSEAEGFVMGKEYEVAKMIAVDADTTFTTPDMQLQSTINGSIAEVKTDVDFLTASLGGTATAPTVSITMAENNLPVTEITTASLSTSVAHLNGLSRVVRDAVAKIYSRSLFDAVTVSMNDENQAGMSAGSDLAISKWTVFATTYGTYTDNNKYDFNADSFGLTGGVTYNFNTKFAIGANLNIDITDLRSENLDNDAFSVALGGHAHYFVNPKWYVTGNTTVSFGSNDAEYTQSIGKTNDSFNSFGLILGAHTGYVLELNKNNIIVPEIGLSYLYSSQDDYSFEFDAPHEIYNIKYNDMSYSTLYADLNLTWQGKYAIQSGIISPTLGVGIRQALTNSDIDTSYVFGGTNNDITITSDDTTFLVDAGLDFTKGSFTIGAKYSGEYGSEQKSHSGSLNFVYKF